MRFVLLGLLVLLLACGVDDAVQDNRPSHEDAARAPEPRVQTSADGHFRVTYQPVPDPIPFNEMFAVEVRIEETASPYHPVTDAVLTRFEGIMLAHGHGMNTVPQIERLRDGLFLVKGMLFHMEGDWHLEGDVEAGDRKDAVSFYFACCD
jgi:hypothetical protein